MANKFSPKRTSARAFITASLSKNSVKMLLVGLCVGATFEMLINSVPECDRGSVVISQQEILEPDNGPDIALMPMSNNNPAQSPESNAISLDDIKIQTGTTNNGSTQAPLVVHLNNVTAEPVFRRPRYMSTELGLRKKLIVGLVLSNASSIEGLLRINQTLTHFVDKVIIFINGTDPVLVNQLKAYDLPGVIAMTLSKTTLKAVQNESEITQRRLVYNYVALKGIKYFADTFVDNYDYFFMALDQYYVHGKLLVDTLRRISVTEKIMLWGNPRADAANLACRLETGFVMSRSLVALLGSRMLRCLSSSVLVNKLAGSAAECIEYLSPDSVCRNTVQGQVYPTVETSADPEIINNAITVGPVSNPFQILEMHAIICKNRQAKIAEEISKLEEKIKWLTPKAPENWRKLTWPIGLPAPHKPKTRFDVNKWIYFTNTTLFLKNEFQSAATLSGVEALDIANILESSLSFLQSERKTESTTGYQFKNGYRRFDPVRGMEYILDFEDSSMQIHRIESLRPLLGNIEIISVPFVTEAKRLTIIIPITGRNVNQTQFFLDHWFDTTTDRKANTIVILALAVLPKSESEPSLSPEQIDNVKQLVNQYNAKPPFTTASNASTTTKASKTNEGLKMGYVVIQLKSVPASNQHFQITLEILEHLGKRTIGPNTLILILELSVNIKEDFLNRVRMNTIANTQVFSPIPFVEYIPQVAFFKQSYIQPKELVLTKLNGYFNAGEMRVISFYYGDFLDAKATIGEEQLSTMDSLLNIFVQGSSLHVFRGTESSFHIRIPPTGSIYEEAICENNISHCTSAWWASKAQLAKVYMMSGVS